MGEVFNKHIDTATETGENTILYSTAGLEDILYRSGKTTTKAGGNSPFPNYGWVCPVCGRGLSPYTSVCPCKGFDPG